MKISVYLTAGLIGVFALGGITSANAQPSRSDTVKRPGPHLVQKKETVRHMLNGHRGMKERRQGYRRHSDGYWYPPAAFAPQARGKTNSRNVKPAPLPPQPQRR